MFYKRIAFEIYCRAFRTVKKTISGVIRPRLPQSDCFGRLTFSEGNTNQSNIPTLLDGGYFAINIIDYFRLELPQ